MARTTPAVQQRIDEFHKEPHATELFMAWCLMDHQGLPGVLNVYGPTRWARYVADLKAINVAVIE
ncbi:hypothetical protein [Chitinolyticbacter meiyuanensis]|uniref:hypothetical protein n=1 Tax=Chitinolyticbacter meiyuanensis TaxID=682798 RepID=UPI0011E5EF1C|nr:hypothetical protein [Chitinolyticbacter meiyuanensis]